MPIVVAKVTAWTETAAEFQPIIARLQLVGLNILNPTLNAVTAWTDDGEQFVTTAEEVQRKLRNREPGNVQMWFAEGRDLFIGWNAVELSIYFDGTSAEERRSVLRLLVDMFVELYEGPGTEWRLCVGIEDVL